MPGRTAVHRDFDTRDHAQRLGRGAGDRHHIGEQAGPFQPCGTGMDITVLDGNFGAHRGESPRFAAKKMAEVHGNRTHPGRYQRPTPDLKSGSFTRQLRTSARNETYKLDGS